MAAIQQAEGQAARRAGDEHPSLAAQLPAGSRVPLALRIFCCAALPLCLGMAIAALATHQLDQRSARGGQEAALDAGMHSLQTITAEQLQVLERTAQLLAADSSLSRMAVAAAAAAESQGSVQVGAQGDTEAGTEQLALSALLLDQRNRLDLGVALVLDVRGNVLGGGASAAATPAGALPGRTADEAAGDAPNAERSDEVPPEGSAVEAALREDAMLAQMLARPRPMSGFWRHQGLLYLAAMVPLGVGPVQVQEPDLQQATPGFLLLARRVDDALANRIASGSTLAIAFWVTGEQGPELVASSLRPEQGRALAQRFFERPDLIDALQLGRPLAGVPLQVDGQQWLLRMVPSAGPGNPALAAATALAAPGATPWAIAGADRGPVLVPVLLAGMALLALSLLLSLWLSRRIQRPIVRLADAALAAASAAVADPVASTHARAGDHPGAGADPVVRLGHALDALLEDLHGRSALEAFVSTFSRMLPEHDLGPGTALEATRLAPPAPASPRRSAVVLLALEAQAAAESTADAAVHDAEQLARRLQDLARLCSGRVLLGDGERWTLAFEGEQRMEHALQAARVALLGVDADAPAGGGLALALAEGEVVSGSLDPQGASLPATMGPPARQLVRLLCESAPGRALIARPLGERIRERFGTEALEVASGALAARRYYALRLAGLGALQHPRHADAAAMEQSAPPAAHGAPEHCAALRPGDHLGTRYQVLAGLCSGSSGAVYKARDLELADVVALKVLGPADLGQPERERIGAEIGLAQRITHPNVLRTFESGEAGGCLYISMEYVCATSLRALLDQAGQVPFAAGVHIARQLCAGLAAAHQAGVLHRDIRPENVLVEAGGRVRLMGFGSLPPKLRERAPDLFSEAPHAAVLHAAPVYAAPEQLAGAAVDARSDIHACGALFSEMFCGGLPYAGEDANAVYLAQVQQEPLRPSELWPEVPVALERIILRCIARRPEDRFHDVPQLQQALAELRC